MKQTEIFITKKYEIFNVQKGNRAINETHVRHLMESMQRLYVPVPIIINSKYEVIDGQHRLEAARRLGLPIHFIMRPDFGLEETKILNENQRLWSAKDFAQSCLEMGNENYRAFLDFTEKYSFGARESIAMLTGKSEGKSGWIAFKEGTFKVKNYSQACLIADRLVEIGKYWEGYKIRSFINAMTIIFKSKDYNHKAFIHKLKTFPSLMIKCVNEEKYKDLIEMIYNYKNIKRVRLF